jgi:predicted SAM-dependent methyltransferase
MKHESLKSFLRKIKMLNFVKSVRLILIKLWGLLIRKRAIAKYLEYHQIRKLQIGCGSNILDGWLNTDIAPYSKNVVPLDARRRFPFDDCTFDYIFSEHLIEHLEYKIGLSLLRECYRILKPGGILRIAMPDLRFLIDLYNSEKTEVQERYIRWAVDSFLPDIGVYQDSFVINNFFQGFNHKFIYDFKTLRGAMLSIGLVNPICYKSGESEDKNLQGIERHNTVVGDEFNRLETIVIEATKPA